MRQKRQVFDLLRERRYWMRQFTDLRERRNRIIDLLETCDAQCVALLKDWTSADGYVRVAREIGIDSPRPHENLRQVLLGNQRMSAKVMGHRNEKGSK